MSEPYLGQIEIFGFGFPPAGWATCAGQLLSITQNRALFTLLGTTFGGDGINTFGLPDLRGRTPIGQSESIGMTPYPIGTAVGEENHTLLLTETPYHGHGFMALRNAVLTDNTYVPDSTVVLAQTVGEDKAGNPLTMNIYIRDPKPDQAMAETSVTSVGGQPHPNLMPYVTVNVCIALQGLPPPPPS